MLYGCENWSRILREERRQRVFENMILKRVFGPKMGENGEIMLQNEELHSLYPSYNIVRMIKSRRLRRSGHVARMEERRSALNLLTGKTKGKRPLVRPKRRWEDNIRIDLKELSVNTRNWIDFSRDRDY